MAMPPAKPLKPPVEPFMSLWCQEQFPEQLRSTSSAEPFSREEYVPIEPFLGRWCFAQFESELSDENEEKDVSKLYKNHVPIEKQLNDWGEDYDQKQQQQQAGSAETVSRNVNLPLEPYIGDWCMSEFPESFGGKNSDDIKAEIAEGEVPVEAMIGDWCFESFPVALSSLNQLSEVQALHQEHEKIENQMLSWFHTEQENLDDLPMNKSWSSVSKTYTTIAFLSIVVATTLITLCMARRKRGCFRDNSISFPPNEEDGEVLTIGTSVNESDMEMIPTSRELV